jgi:hypothetical protein
LCRSTYGCIAIYNHTSIDLERQRTNIVPEEEKIGQKDG